MKHLFTLFLATMMAVSANAESSFVRKQVELKPVKVNEAFKMPVSKVSAMHSKARKNVNAQESALNIYLGDFVHSQWAIDPNDYYDWIGSNCDLHITQNEDGTIAIQNLLGFGDITATYNEEDESLVAAPMQFLFESVYGNVAVCSLTITDDGDVVMGEEDEIYFSIDDENRFWIDNDGIAMVLMDGPYKGYIINNYYFFNQFDRVNATMTYIDADNDPITLDVAIDGDPEDGIVDVYGFGDVSCVAIEIEGNQVMVPAGQSVFYYSDYGMFYVYGMPSFGQFTDEVEGTYDSLTRTIALNNLCVFCKDANAFYDTYSNVSITWNDTDLVAIQQIEANAHHNRIYDLQGRVVNRTQQGQFYINNGVKFFAE